MTLIQFGIFLAALALPTIYQRTKFALSRRSFETLSNSRAKSGLQIHHGHWGFLFELIASFALAFGFRNTLTIGLAGLGWGLMLDEIVPMLKMPTPGRELELQVYARTQKATFVTIGVVCIASLVLYFFF